MAGTLYTYPENFRACKVLIAAQYSGAEVKVVSEPPEFQLGVTNKTPEFLAKFPLGKVPAFETADGAPIFESNAIAYYVAKTHGQLRGGTQLDAALVQQFVNFADNEILPAACTWVFPTLGIMQYNKQATEQAQQTIRTCLEYLNQTLATRTFLVGERASLADISCVCNLLLLYQQVLDPAFRGPYGNVNRWFVTCVNQPQFKAVLGDVQLCSKMAAFDAKKYSELFPKKEKKKKEEGEGKQQEPKKEKAPKKQTPKKKEEEEEEEEDEIPKPKFVDPYLSLPKGWQPVTEEEEEEEEEEALWRNLPKSPFVLDTFKKVYSNEDIATKAIPYFWENFDKEGWSIWTTEYKYPEELKKIFMTSNLVSGMLQRIENYREYPFQRTPKLRKYAFASVLIIGEDNNNIIEGVWVLRGQELAFDLVENWNIDAPSYNFTKMDPDSEEDRKTINKYLLWEGDFGGRPVADGKVFK